MLEILRRLVQAVGRAENLDDALAVAVRWVKQAMEVDACGVFLCDPASGDLVFRAVAGYDPASVGEVRLAFGEGLVGMVAERGEPINLRNASEHAQFRYFPITGEERYRAFLGVPIIHFRKVLGVLLVQHRGDRVFDSEQEAFLVTVSAQLAGALHAAAVSDPARPLVLPPQRRRFLEGVGGAPGIAIGTLVLPSPFADLHAVPDRAALDNAAEEAAFLAAVENVQSDLQRSGARMEKLLPSEAAALFEVYALLLGDGSLSAKTLARIRAGQWAPAALRDTIAELAAQFEALPDDYLRARAEDVRAVGRRLLLELQADLKEPREYPSDSVLIGDEVSLARIAEVPPGRLAGVIALQGSALSHTAIVARALGVPAVFGVGDLDLDGLDGCSVVVDGYGGRVLFEPSASVRREFDRLAREERRLTANLAGLRELPAETPDGVVLPLYVNAGPLNDVRPALDAGAAGVGLYRTEFTFMLRHAFPGEDEQVGIYRAMLSAFAPRPVTMRTLDIGGDKTLPYFPIEEQNPFLGWRGIRVALQHPEIFLTQLKALLRANAGLGNLRLLLPMVSTLEELREAKRLIGQAHASLRRDGRPAAPAPVGVMLEVPAALFQVEQLAAQADFFSLGTNDLTQYLLAVDRNNRRVASLYDHLHPAVLRVIWRAVQDARAAGRPISVCGELAGDPAGALLLLGAGVDYLSMAAAGLPRIKWVVRSFTRADAGALCQQALAMDDAAGVRRLLHQALQQAGLGGLVHAGGG